MDALIRSARLAPHRTRLSEAPAGRSRGTDAASQPDEALSAAESMRAAVEKQVRDELALHLQKLHESERARGYADGYADGLNEAQVAAMKELAQTHEQLRAEMEGALCALEQAHRAALAILQSSVGEVAFAAVCRLVGQKAGSRELVLDLVERTCAQLRGDVLATARLHPRDIQVLQELLQDRELRVRSLGLKVFPDEALELGGCVIEAASGQYDGGLEGQLRRLHAVLAGAPVLKD
jgi:flagellar assembly protein FliH